MTLRDQLVCRYMCFRYGHWWPKPPYPRICDRCGKVDKTMRRKANGRG